MRMKLSMLIRNMHCEYLGREEETEIRSVEYDSRKVQEGSLFVAVRGYETDGHQYIPMALEKGAAAIILEDQGFLDKGISAYNGVFLKVPDSRIALAQASAAFFGHPALSLKVIGVTGTNGKTSVTHLLKSILTAAGHKAGVIGTIENQIGEESFPAQVTTPESKDLQELLHQMVEKGCEYCIMEASSHALYLERTHGIPFRGGIFTNLTQDHLDFHGTMEAYLEAKLKLFKGLSQEAFAIINRDDPAADKVAAACPCPVTGYSLHAPSELQGREIHMSLKGTSYFVETGQGRIQIKMGLMGAFSIYNSLAALGAALALGIPPQAIEDGIARVKVKGRFEVVESQEDFAVVVDYAHTPDGLFNVLASAREISQGRVLCVFGCGGDRDRSKRPLMGRVAAEGCDEFIITSDNPRTEDPMSIIRMIEAGAREAGGSFQTIENRKDAIGAAIAMAKPGDIVVIAGKGHEDYQILGREKIHFSDVETAREFLDKGRRKA